MFKQAYELGLDPELQVYAKNGHGFGAGNAGTTSIKARVCRPETGGSFHVTNSTAKPRSSLLRGFVLVLSFS